MLRRALRSVASGATKAGLILPQLAPGAAAEQRTVPQTPVSEPVGIWQLLGTRGLDGGQHSPVVAHVSPPFEQLQSIAEVSVGEVW